MTEKFSAKLLNRRSSSSSSSISIGSERLKPSAAGDIDAPRPFIIKNKADCFHVCHSRIMDRFGENRYDIITGQIGVLTTTLSELQEFIQSTSSKARSPSLASEEGLIVDYAPFHPDMKISSDVRDLFTTTTTKSQTQTSSSSDTKKAVNTANKGGNNEKVWIKILLHGLTSSQHQTFLTTLTTEINRYNGVIKLEGLNQVIQENERSAYIVDITDMNLMETMIRFLANQPEIYFIERQYPIIWHNRWSKGICDAGTTEETPLDDWNITGDGEIVGISDTGLDMKNCYFYDPNTPTPFNKINKNHRKVIYYRTTDGDRYDTTEGHGTHVAGSAAGLAYKNYGDYTKFQGMAHDAKIAFADLLRGDSTSGAISPPSNLIPMFTDLDNAGAHVISNSWGTSDNSYASYAVNVDTFMRNNPDTLILFSAGNSGESGSNTVGSPATNKNGVTVGASLNDRDSWKAILQNSNPDFFFTKDAVGSFSSRGPTKDNRLKPDVLAPGYYIYSAKGVYNASSYHCDIKGLSGTSMAAPTMAGFAIKIRQYYRSGYYPTGHKVSANGFTPSAALIKATLIHSGQQVSYLVDDNPTGYATLSTYPSTIQGYGRIQMNKVLNFGTAATTSPITMYVVGGATSSDAHYDAITVTGQVKTYTFTTSSSSTQPSIRVTFCYTDYPGSVGASNAMVNVLTMVVKNAAGTTQATYAPSGLIQSNTQVVDIKSPTPSTTYTITITGTTISQSPQPIALVVTGSLSYLNVTSTSSSSKNSDEPTINYDTTAYIIFLAVLVFVFIVLYYYFYRISRENLLNDARNYGEYDPLDFDNEHDGGNGRGKKNNTLLQRVFKKPRTQA